MDDYDHDYQIFKKIIANVFKKDQKYVKNAQIFRV